MNNTLEQDMFLTLKEASEMIGLTMQTLRKSYLNPIPNQKPGDKDFNPAKLNTNRYSPKSNHRIRRSEVERFRSEAYKG